VVSTDDVGRDVHGQHVDQRGTGAHLWVGDLHQLKIGVCLVEFPCAHGTRFGRR